MGELKTYFEWERIFEREHKCRVINPNGARMVISQKRENDLMTKQEAFNYFMHNTVRMKINDLKQFEKYINDNFEGDE